MLHRFAPGAPVPPTPQKPDERSCPAQNKGKGLTPEVGYPAPPYEADLSST